MKQSIQEFLSYLSSLDINLRVDDADLCCDAPKGVLTPELRGSLAKRKPEIIAFLQESDTNTIRPFPRIGDIPLSFAQERLWFLNQLEGDSAPYNEAGAINISGNLNVPVLEQALVEIVQRHEVLRTSFQMKDGVPYQIISPTPNITFDVVDLQQLPETSQSDEVTSRANSFVQKPFDLSEAPLLRVSLLHLGENSYILIFVMHHIVGDGWSIEVLQRELNFIYSAYCQGKDSPLPELKIQYADFTFWQRQWLTQERLANELSYWKEQLAGVPPLLELPTDRPRPPVQTFRGSKECFVISASLTSSLKNLSKKSGVTLYMTLLAAFSTLLYRYSGQSDIVVGSPIAGRNRSEIEGLIGFFVNTLVLRIQFEENLSFQELIHQVRKVTLDAYEHQDLPFEQLVSELQPERNLSHSPLFQVMLVLQNVPMRELELPGITWTPLSIEAVVAKFDLTLSIEETDSVLSTTWEYNTDLFDASTVQRMAGHFQTFLESIVANPSKSVSVLPLLSEAQRHKILVEWNDTATDYPSDKCIHELFDEQVSRTPDAVAVVFEESQLTYRELNDRANKLAHYLRSLGVGPEVLVGICVERSLEMVVGLLGILKAGGAYVPLDPTYPTERISYMLSDARVTVLLTQEKLVEGLPENEAFCVRLDTNWGIISQHNDNNPVKIVKPDNLAYVIYTSGSTGKPKGVLITHSNIVHLFQATQSLYHFDEQCVWTLFHSIAFDFSVWELWGALIYGGRVVVVPYDISRSPQELYELLVKEKVTVLNQTPSAFRQLIQLEEELLNVKGNNIILRYVIFGGEALELNSLKPCVDKYGDSSPKLVNMYGISETTVHVTYKQLRIADFNDGGSIIGFPIQDRQIYILDKYLQPVPIGVPGELHISGAGLARGYLNRPELTADKFIPHPFSNEPGACLYKTGDRARYRTDGNIEFLGRIDNQVKIRGFRIELGEVEATLAQHPSVQEAVVIAREDIPGDKRLVAYIVGKTEPPTAKELWDFLKGKLPGYMVPAAFVTLEAMPLTPNGKVDRRALPAPDTSALASTATFVAPETPTAELLAGIWSEVLGLKNVGGHDNFFELGGHSLLATRVTSRIREVFSIEVPLAHVFEFPTLATLSKAIEAQAESGLQAPAIVRVSRDAAIGLSFAQERLWFLNQLEGQSATYNIPGALRLDGQVAVAALEQGITEIVRRHEALRTRFTNNLGTLTQIIAPAAPVTVPVIDLQDITEEKQAEVVLQLATEEGQRPFDLSGELLLRVKLLRLSAESHVLLLTMHHIVSDGWSIGVFCRELQTLYQAYARGEASPLPELAIQYADFAIWQRQWLSGEVGDIQLSYWKQQLAGVPTLLELPTDRQRPPVQSFRGSRESFQLDEKLTDRLKQVSLRAGVTLFMTLLAAFATLLYRYSGQEDIVIGSPIANRNRSQIEPLIGFFVNTLALRIALDKNPSFAELLSQVRKVCLEAYGHQDLPFEVLVDALQPTRNLSITPLFQVMFAMQNAPSVEPELPGLKCEMLEVESGVAKFDMTLSMAETSQGITGDIEYNSDLFDGARIRRMIGHFGVLLEAIASNPEARVDQLPLLSEQERHQLLVEWNDTANKYPSDKCIHELFDEQVSRTPDAVAVVFEESQLTYQELNSRANKLAHYLRRLGVGPEVLVGICVERSIEMVVGLLSILKAGGAYVPLDPAYPPERIAYMLSDAQVPVLLTLSKLVDSLGSTDGKVVCLDEDRGAIASEKEDNPGNLAALESLAYVIYTSGSTGQPKGVQISHGSLVNFLDSTGKIIGVTDSDTMLAVTAISFDIAALEIYLPLLVGGKIILAPREVATDGYMLLSKLVGSGTTIMQGTPATWQMLVVGGWSRKGKLKMLCGGEALPRELGRNLLEKGGSLWNMYGPTETTVWSTVYQVLSSGQETCNSKASESIGVAIGNTQVYILDSHLQPVPIGVPGELYIGGAPLARGYLNRPELTADKFIPNPFSNEPGARLYKTGDRARYRRDGNIEFLGRIDNQVKIRGFRIELGEIEATLAQHPGVVQAAVIAREDIPGDKRLVAYIVTKREPPTVRELGDFLKGKLPEYMVPSAFVTLEAMPLTPNGKVDRRALPAPDTSALASTATFVAPETPTAELLAGIWSEVLGLKKVGIHDNFFELGGHSLLATQVISRIRLVFSVEVPVRHVFEFPTLGKLSKAIEAQAESGWQAPAIVRVSREVAIPLSFAQERLWFLNQLEGQSATYNIPGALRLDGQVAVAALELALTEIVRRHEALRTRFTNNMGTLTQIIAPAAPVTVPVIDLQEITKDQLASEVQRLATEEGQRPFDLSGELLLRVKLLRLSAESHVFLLTMHHIVSDGWSIGVFCRELQTLYQAFARGEASPLPELAIQYADFAVWQLQWLSGEVLDMQLDYWKQQLAGVPTLLELPTDRPRPPVQTFRGSRESFQLEEKLTDRLKQVSSRAGVTLFMTLLAAFATLLYRYSGQEDMVIGSPIANRNRSQIEPLIGFFVNTLALRIALENNPSFAELLSQVRKVCLEAYGHQDLPFEVLVEALQPTRNLSHTPLFQVMFAMQNAQSVELELPGLKCEMLEVEMGVAKFDITLSMAETSTGIAGDIEYNSDLFDGARIRSMIGHFQRLLEASVRNPEARVDKLPLLTEQERHQLLVEWNDTATDYPSDKCIHELFEKQVERTPDAVAVVKEESQLTYRELNSRANKLAHYLRSLGVGPEVLVGICVERSIEMVVGLLSILKAGGAYVPLDPAYPPDRIAYMLSDAQVPVLLTLSKLVEDLGSTDGKVVCLDEDWGAIAPGNEQNNHYSCLPTSLAYVLYTSGSTGLPKGVAIEHSSVVALLSWAQESFTAFQLAGVLASTSICFDLSVFELFLPISCGGKIILAKSALDLPSLPAASDVTIINTVPSALAELLRMKGIPPRVRTVNLAGEPLKRQLVELLYNQQTISEVYNLYGPSEDTTYSTFALVEKGASKAPHIGHPIDNTQTYILDNNLQPLPVGVPGELYIGGAGLARGYLNRPSLTLSKFIPNPFSNEPGDRLYKTGDRARYRTDGNIEFLGRIDNQVKIRGFRIELGEIEATLAQHPGVVQAVVIAREDIPGDKRLVAYIVGKTEPPTARELRDFLKAKLPGYMVPAAFVTLEAMPLTPNGKVDRRSLPAPEGIRPELAGTYVMPQTESEKLIAAVWQDVLKLDKVGIHDNFFDLGGNSLLIVRVQSKLLSIFDLELSIVDLFNFPTIQELAQHLSQQQDRSPGSELRGDRVQMRTERQGARKEKRQQRKKYR